MKQKINMLNKIISDGEKISLTDGSMLLIDPSDMPTVCTWIPTATIRVVPGDESRMFSHRLINENINVSVCARKISES